MLRKILKLYIKTETNISLLSLFWKEYVFFYILKALLTPFHIQVQAISFMAGKALPNYITCTWTMQPFTSLYMNVTESLGNFSPVSNRIFLVSNFTYLNTITESLKHLYLFSTWGISAGQHYCSLNHYITCITVMSQ